MDVFAAAFVMLPVVTFLGGLAGLIWGIATSGHSHPNAYLNREFGIRTATPARRLSGNLLDYVIFSLTAGIGWLIWFAIVAPRGQSPGKALVSTYVMSEDGSCAGGWYMWGREVLVKWLLFYFLGIATYGVALVVAAFWCLWDDDKQCVWDKIMSPYVAHSPDGPPDARLPETIEVSTPVTRLRQLRELRTEGVVTAEEYEERRRRLVQHL